MAFTEGFVSELVGRKATVNQIPIGKVSDFLVNKPDEVFPKIDGLVIKTTKGLRFAPMETVSDVDADGSIALSLTPKEPAPPEADALYLIADLLDKQIVDVDGRKVVRINDIEIAKAGDAMRVVAADVGVAGLLRRLGLKAFGRKFTPAIYRSIPRSMIAWDSVSPIRDTNPSQVSLSVTESKLSRLHPSELADIIDISAREAAAVVRHLDDETAADAFEHLEPETQRSLIEDIGTERAADIIEEMDADDAADLLAELDEDQQQELLAEMNEYTASELRQLVKYAEDTAGGLMTTDYTWMYPHRTAEATIRKIREIAPTSEFIYYLYVVDKQDTLLGALSLRTLLLADPEETIDAIMETDLVTLRPDTPAEEVAATIAQYDLLSVPIVDDAGKMLGIVTVDDAINAIMPEDMAKRLPKFTSHRDRAGLSMQASGAVSATTEQLSRRRSLWRSLLLIAAVLGPGFVTASAGNDVGGIATYSSAGAQFGYNILWVMVPLAVALIVVQEMSARMGCVTGKGLAALIRENFGVRISLLAMIVLFFINTLITSTEFAGIAAAAENWGISRYVAVPVALVCVFFFVLRFNTKVVERTFVVFSLMYLMYIVSAVLAHPDWHQVATGAFIPHFEWHTTGWIAMVITVIGTTISPYMQFFLQSQVVEKGERTEDLPFARADVINGSVLAIALAGFMIIANAATIFLANEHGAKLNPQQAMDFAVALKPLAGAAASTIFAIGILNAGLFTATVLPLSTSYIICEALGFEAAVDRKFSEAPVFFTLFAAGLILGAGFVLTPGLPLLKLILFAQALQGALLPFELVLMLIIINRKSVMGNYTNGVVGNVIAWMTAIVIGVLSILSVASPFIPQLGGG